jgi:hypothetical protein
MIPLVLALGVVVLLWAGRPGWAVVCAVICAATVPTSSTAGSIVHGAAGAVTAAFHAGATFFS